MLNKVPVINDRPEVFPLQAVEISFLKKSDVAAAHKGTRGSQKTPSVENPATANKISSSNSLCEGCENQFSV